MKNLKTTLVTAMVSSALFLTGCGAPPEETQATLPPLTTEVISDTENHTDETEPMEPNIEQMIGGFTGCFGPRERENLQYTGGIMTVPFQYAGYGTGVGGKNGFGVLLILNGVPQPYYTDTEPEWAYLHMMPSEPNVDHVVDLHLIPVTGNEGDQLILSLIKVTDPGYRKSKDGTQGFKLVDNSTKLGRPIEFLATPPECPMPEFKDRFLGIKMLERETNYAEIAGWSDQELIFRTAQASDLKVGDRNSAPYSEIYDASAEEPVTLHVDVWGNPAARQSLVLYVNNEPLIVDPEQIIQFSTKEGMTTEFDISIDNSDMQEETIIYGIRIIENYLECDPDKFGDIYNTIDPRHILIYSRDDERFQTRVPQ